MPEKNATKKTTVSKKTVKKTASKTAPKAKAKRARSDDKKTLKPKKSVTPKQVKAKKEATKKSKAVKETNGPKLRYYEAVGRRKRAVARVRLFTKGDKEFIVNLKPYTDYFRTPELQGVASGALKKMKVEDKFSVSALVSGGGQSGQAEAVRHGISRALLRFNPDFQKRLKRVGFLSRDPREKERRKFGLKKARRAPQWSKR